MAYQTGSAIDLGDLLSKLDTFLTGAPSSTILGGFTQDDFDDGVSTAAEGFANWTKSTLSIGLKWVANAPNNMSIHQALAYSGSGFPGAHTDDSGNGYNAAFGTDAQLDDERCVNDIGDGPFVSYHFFGDATLNYCHVVVEIESEVFRHFGFGDMEKFNDWTGGEYCYGNFQDEAINSSGVDLSTFAFMDGLNVTTSSPTARRNATIHAEGLPHQGVNEKWLQHAGGVTAFTSEANWRDSANEIKRISFGGFRAGPVAYLLGEYRSDISTGHIPMYPFALLTRDFTNQFIYFLGNIPDTRGIDMFNFSPGQEVTAGSDVWIVFPAARRTEDNVINRTYYQGIAYKKVT